MFSLSYARAQASSSRETPPGLLRGTNTVSAHREKHEIELHMGWAGFAC
jgi:hypothetical protein